MYQKSWSLPPEPESFQKLGGLILQDKHYQKISSADFKDRAALVVYIYEKHLERFSDEFKQLKDKLPNLNIIGVTSIGNVLGFEYFKVSLKASLIIMKNSKITPFIYNLKDLNEKQMGEKFVHDFKYIKDLKGILLFGSGVDLQIERFYHRVENGWKNIPIFGSFSGSYNGDDKNNLLFLNDHIYTYGIGGLAFSGKVNIGTASTLDWQPVGKTMKVTKMVTHNEIAEIDNQPAATIYQKYLRIQPDKYFIPNICEFPMVVNRNGVLITLTTMAASKDSINEGHLKFMVSFHEGEKLRLAIGQPSILLTHSKQNAERLAKTKPEAVFVFPCGDRLSLLGVEREEKELSYFKEIAPEAITFYGNGELLRQSRRGGAMNAALVAVSLSEKDGEKVEAFTDYQTKSDMTPQTLRTGMVPLLDRVLYFLDKTTSELEESNMLLSETARTDELTGLTNRRGIDEKAEQLLFRPGLGLGVIMFDIDHFKIFNDQYGHDAGDLVLQHVSKIAKRAVDNNGMVGRWGGEEFMVLLPNFNIKETSNLADKIRLMIKNSKLDDYPEITVSLGATVYRDEDTRNCLFKRVDGLLYKAKNSGRNRVEVG